MQIRIPKVFTKVLAVTDRLACRLLLPPRPVGLRIRGYDVTWLEKGG